MEKDFFNTTNLSGNALKKEREAAKNQQERILLIFKQFRKGMTPTRVHFIHNDLFQYNRCPITSIRRAITNLTDAGKLVKTDAQKNGAYGKPNCVWELPLQQNLPKTKSKLAPNKDTDLFPNFKLKNPIKKQ